MKGAIFPCLNSERWNILLCLSLERGYITMFEPRKMLYSLVRILKNAIFLGPDPGKCNILIFESWKILHSHIRTLKDVIFLDPNPERFNICMSEPWQMLYFHVQTLKDVNSHIPILKNTTFSCPDL